MQKKLAEAKQRVTEIEAEIEHVKNGRWAEGARKRRRLGSGELYLDSDSE